MSTLFELEAYKAFQQKTKADGFCCDVRFKSKFSMNFLEILHENEIIMS